MPAERRRQRGLRALRSGGPAAVTDLSEQLGVSPATIRRDLLKPDEDGLLTRVHGGAVAEAGEKPFAEVAEVRLPAKDAMAERAAALVRDGRSVLLGGMARREYRSLVGILTEDNLRRLHAGRLFLGTSGIRPGGQVMDTTLVEVPVKRAMIGAGDKIVLLADAAKFPGTGTAKVCGAEDLDLVVTDAPVDTVTRSALQDAGVEVLMAKEVTV
ncbi:DeoR/GlpR family DNA-binding transcription regulator [Streptomyces sp. NPDC001508]|uniref:DeoR/GlpR family DNA-binding transcription regulator n=1 Tax=Streptomyces sp. NPDC001508 TaxID=3154656 RepID=UPI00332A12D7